MTAQPPDPRRRKELAQIHVAKEALGLDEPEYRALLKGVTGKESAGEMGAYERREVLLEMGRLGWKPFRRGKGARRPKVPLDREEQYRKVTALWLALRDLGAVRDGSPEAVAAFVKRQTKVDNPAWATAEQLVKVIEGLKKWKVRVESARPPRAPGRAGEPSERAASSDEQF